MKKRQKWMKSANENCSLICEKLMECECEFDLNGTVRKYHNEIFVHPGLRQMLKSTINRIATKKQMQEIYS